jgi:tRNA-2-methylthio-N6-dimethylallyladenosine synthase
MSQKIFIKTFGCQMNEYDSNRIFDTVKKIGYDKTNVYEEANCYILNTCHIRDKAKEKVYHEIGRVKKIFRSKKKPLVIVAGCVAQAENQEMLKREPYIDLVIGPQSYHEINNKILDHIKQKEKLEMTEFEADLKFDYLSKIKNESGKISSFLTIQEGCDKFCHFCVVPFTRGPEYSRPFKQIIDEAKQLADNGVREITLLGQNVNAYNYEDLRLSNLIYEIEKLPEIKRVRYTTSHPNDMTDDLIEVYKYSHKLMPLVHLPIQSGSNKILNLMNRKHSIADYMKIVEKLKNINEKIEFSSDFIIGYPGEDQKDYEDTLNLIKRINFINSYSFIFSPRPGTVAENLKLVEKKISTKRLEKVQSQLFENQIIMNKSFENKILNVLVENLTEDKTQVFGRSEHMTPVIFNGKEDDIGKILPVRIKQSNRSTLFGELINDLNQKVA